MTRDEWVVAHTYDLIHRQHCGERTAALLAVAVADAHTRIKGPDVELWPAPDMQVRFSTTPDEDDPL